MNRFEIVKCVEINENGYDGPCVILACISDPSFMLFFPITKDNAKIINYVLQDNSKYDINTNILGIYKTMVESWKVSDKYLSGIIMDAVYDEEVKEDTLMIRLALGDANGNLDSLVHVNFVHSVILAAMEGVDIVVGNKLVEKMVPEDEEDDNAKKTKATPIHFPEDKKIVDIAKKIMGGKIKDK